MIEAVVFFKNGEGKQSRSPAAALAVSLSRFLRNHLPECNEADAQSKTRRKEKWSRTKHLETAKDRFLEMLAVTGGVGVFARALGHVAVINGRHLKRCLFCHERTPA